jgi:hypothetical protein
VWLIWWCGCICYQVLAGVCLPHCSEKGRKICVCRSAIRKVCNIIPFKPECQRAHSFPFGYLEGVATVLSPFGYLENVTNVIETKFQTTVLSPFGYLENVTNVIETKFHTNIKLQTITNTKAVIVTVL